MTLRRDLAALQAREFDVVVVGGGISGACVAHDAALRGLSVALVEKHDFGSATSAASSKILHSGIRYLQQVDIRKLRESAIERSTFQRIAPHLTRYVPFLIPTYRGLVKGRAALWTAVRLHELLSAGSHADVGDPSKRVPRSQICTRTETVAFAPVLEGRRDLTGSCLIHESHMHSSERMTLAFVKSAASSGAVVANYLGALGLLSSNRATRGLTVRDEISGDSFDIRARVIINAAGPWIPDLCQRFGLSGLHRPVAGFSRGAHIVTRALTSDVALVLPTARRQQALIDRGGRHLFVIPWRGVSLIGTSNAPFGGGLDQVQATAEDVAGLLADMNEGLPGTNLDTEGVHHAFAGLYPLTEEVIEPAIYQATGSYQLVDHGSLGHLDRVVSVLGAKYTTARRLAQLAVDLTLKALAQPAGHCTTSITPLSGGAIADLPSYLAQATSRYGSRLQEEIIRHLVDHYGTEIDAVLATSASGIQPDAKLSPTRECIEAEVLFAVTAEMALHLDDVVFRRTGLGTIGHPGAAALARCAAIMAAALGWSDQQVEQEVHRTEARFTLST